VPRVWKEAFATRDRSTNLALLGLFSENGHPSEDDPGRSLIGASVTAMRAALTRHGALLCSAIALDNGSVFAETAKSQVSEVASRATRPDSVTLKVSPLPASMSACSSSVRGNWSWRFRPK
jgi:hypothetical protein